MANFNVIQLKDAPKAPFPLDGRILFTSPELEMIHLTLKPGESTDPHIQPFDVLFYVIDGIGDLIVENDSLKVTAGTLIEIRQGTMRNWINPKKNNLQLMAIKRFK